MARRGGVKRISAGIYDETRAVLRARLEEVRFSVRAVFSPLTTQHKALLY